MGEICVCGLFEMEPDVFPQVGWSSLDGRVLLHVLYYFYCIIYSILYRIFKVLTTW